MDFDFTAEHESFRAELRKFLAQELDPERVKPHLDPKEFSGYSAQFEKEFRRKLGQRGYLGMAWPKEYGGQGKDMTYQAILTYEMAYAGAPQLDIAVELVAPPLMLFGSEEQKKFYLPKIVKGEVGICLGYSEPGAGSDLAGLQTRAALDGDEFVINGQKVFTTDAHKADYCWMVVRTDLNAPKHHGISLMIVDMKTPGITPRPLWTITGWRHNEVFFDNVRVPKTALVGEMNRGWYLLAKALDFERSGYSGYGKALRYMQAIIAFCKTHTRNGKPLIQDPVIRAQIAQMKIDYETGLRFSKRVAWMQASGQIPNVEASINKVWNTELVQRICNLGTRIMGLYGALTKLSPHAPAGGIVEHGYLNHIPSTIGGGSNEIQRNIMAQRGLGLPR